MDHSHGYCDCAEPLNAQPANWPDRCRTTLRVHWHPTFKTHRAFANVDFRAILRQALDAWEEVIDARFQIVDEYDPPRSEIFLHPHPFPSSVLADAQLAQNRCDTSLRGRYDTTVTWRSGRLFSTLVHEIGHHLGLRHENNSRASLYYAINADWKRPHELDIRQALRLGYNRATDRPDPPAPPPEPPPDPDPPTPPDPDPPDPDPPAPPIPPRKPPMFEGLLGKLLEMLMGGLMKNCLESNGREATATQIKRKGRVMRRIIHRQGRRLARRENGRDWEREHRAELEARINDEIDNLTEAEVDALVDEAAAED